MSSVQQRRRHKVLRGSLPFSPPAPFSLDEDWWWHVLSLTHNGNLPEDGGNTVGLAAGQTSEVSLDSSGDVLSNITTLPNLVSPEGNNFVHTDATTGSEVDRVFVDVPNFNGEPTVGTAFDESVNILVATWQHFNTNYATDPTLYLLSSIPEPGVGNSVGWGGTVGTTTRAQLDAWVSFSKSAARRSWFTSTLVNEAASDEPSGTFSSVDVMGVIWDAIRGTALNDMNCAALYSDKAPHGNPDWYQMQGIVIWSLVMNSLGAPDSVVLFPAGSVTWPAGVTATFTAAASDFASRVFDLVKGNAVVPNAPQTDEIEVSTGAADSEIDVTVSSVPETLLDIEYRWAHGTGSWISLGISAAGSATITAAAASTSYDLEFRYVTSAGNGRGSTSDDDGHWTVTSAAAGGTWTGWKSAGTVAIDGADSGNAWDPDPDTSNLASDDASTANLFIGSGTTEFADGCVVSNFSFSTSDIPSSSTINGIELEILASEGVAGRDVTVMGAQVTVDGGSTFIGTAKDDQGTIAGTEVAVTIGGDTDVFGTSITDTQVRSANFGLHFSFRATADTPVLVQIDRVRVRVNYS